MERAEDHLQVPRKTNTHQFLISGQHVEQGRRDGAAGVRCACKKFRDLTPLRSVSDDDLTKKFYAG